MWNLLVNKILFELNNKNIIVVAYVEVIVLLIKGKFVCAISDLKESTMGTLLKLTKENGLAVNPPKIKLISFIRK